MSLTIIRKDSDHHGERLNGAKPIFLIMHYTETRDASDADGYFTGAIPHPTGGRVSAHYMIDTDGTITQYVEEDRRAWHAGVSEWESITDINTHSIGIELVNPGPKYGYKDFPSAQINALIMLSQEILSRHDIPAHHILGHSDIAPGRKIDPGEKFPWQILAEAGVGIWPQSGGADNDRAITLLHNEEKLKQALVDYGYSPAHNLNVLVTEFQRHFQPEAFRGTTLYAGTPNDETAARLVALLKMKSFSYPSGRGIT